MVQSIRQLISPLVGEMSGRTEGGATEHSASAPIIPILFYRSMLLAADVAPIDALVAALRDTGPASRCRSSSPA